ncbi:MAG: glutathione peroxidase [Deltaproteobacteria bacterium]|nr:glutathione peroxidase [Deltaproteobacteria bacterium]
MTLNEIEVTKINGAPLKLSELAGSVVLFVNVASRCGFTPQYAGLEALHRELSPKGLVVVGVPANEFGAQEPGSNDEIESFCGTKYNVTFTMLAKQVVKGGDISALYQWLTTGASPSGDVQWNFEKFVVNREGQIVGRFRSNVTPESRELRDCIVNVL